MAICRYRQVQNGRHVTEVDAIAAAEDGARLLKALAHPMRLALVLLLADEPRSVHELAERLDSPQPLVSQHLRILRAERLVSGDRSGREVIYRLEDEHVGHIARDANDHAKEHR
jgi:ArsR family transcriptional regulator, zinc-responsive transcriptional repressor